MLPWEPSILHNPWVRNDGAWAACCSSRWMLSSLSATKQISRSYGALQEVPVTGTQFPKHFRVGPAATVVLTITQVCGGGALAHHCQNVYPMFIGRRSNVSLVINCKPKVLRTQNLPWMAPTAAPTRVYCFIGWILMWPFSLPSLWWFQWCGCIWKHSARCHCG